MHLRDSFSCPSLEPVKELDSLVVIKLLNKDEDLAEISNVIEDINLLSTLVVNVSFYLCKWSNNVVARCLARDVLCLAKFLGYCLSSLVVISLDHHFFFIFLYLIMILIGRVCPIIVGIMVDACMLPSYVQNKLVLC